MYKTGWIFKNDYWQFLIIRTTTFLHNVEHRVSFFSTTTKILYTKTAEVVLTEGRAEEVKFLENGDWVFTVLKQILSACLTRIWEQHFVAKAYYIIFHIMDSLPASTDFMAGQFKLAVRELFGARKSCRLCLSYRIVSLHTSLTPQQMNDRTTYRADLACGCITQCTINESNNTT